MTVCAVHFLPNRENDILRSTNCERCNCLAGQVGAKKISDSCPSNFKPTLTKPSEGPRKRASSDKLILFGTRRTRAGTRGARVAGFAERLPCLTSVSMDTEHAIAQWLEPDESGAWMR